MRFWLKDTPIFSAPGLAASGFELIQCEEGLKMGQLILSCTKTGRAFKSGFRATRTDLGYVPPKWKATLLCAICHRVHEFNFAEARVCECADDCYSQYSECQNCKFAVRETPAAA